MKKLFGINPINEVLNVENNKILIFTPLTEEVCNAFNFELQHFLSFPKISNRRKEINSELYESNKIQFTDIVAIGDTKMETRQANGYIENQLVKINDITRRSYKCFVNKDWKEPKNMMNLPYHDDGGCAWNCLMDKLNRPKFGIIYSILLEDKNFFKLNY